MYALKQYQNQYPQGNPLFIEDEKTPLSKIKLKHLKACINKLETTMKSYTDIEQSKVLAETLPLESADNVIVSFGSREGTKNVVMPKETLDVIRTPFADIKETNMCWSLAALLDVLPNYQLQTQDDGIGVLCSCNGKFNIVTTNNPVDACYEMIIKLSKLKML